MRIKLYLLLNLVPKSKELGKKQQDFFAIASKYKSLISGEGIWGIGGAAAPHDVP
ncbi:MAG TPA: hypothetical protein IGS52_09475 [Oscillatoriaceae cyanobacterium M33_DOE_052]|nr:hypothetical protein [Oscillatoriaceae cyanobacterium M33_DOE_052]